MTNKKLIDHCNSFWGEDGYCGDCKYSRTYCEAFYKKYRITPYREDMFHEEWYTDEEIEDEN